MLRNLSHWTPLQTEHEGARIHRIGPLTERDIATLVSMPALVHLTLEDIDVFPAALCALPRLRVLRIIAPRLATLPDEIADLAALAELDIRATSIRELPARLAQRARARVILVWRPT